MFFIYNKGSQAGAWEPADQQIVGKGQSMSLGTSSKIIFL
jgi:hypothetical protein